VKWNLKLPQLPNLSRLKKAMGTNTSKTELSSPKKLFKKLALKDKLFITAILAAFVICVGFLISVVIQSKTGKKKVALDRKIPKLSKSIVPQERAIEFTIQLGLKLIREGEVESAKNVFEKLLVTHPNNVSILNNLGYLMGEMGNWAKASLYLEKAIQISNNCAECLNNLGTALQRQGKVIEARKMFEQAVNADPKFLDPKLNLAVLYEMKGDWALALEWYKKSAGDLKDSKLTEWVNTRALWMAEITKEKATREIAKQK